ncbi:Hypothetical_protein [Hexamita inflata]|uniref:Hypothetical_protein n=1 Tax=Hexamita inflata TaxID=28002 RepID=A0ABP1L231_9EUKA
MFTYENGYRITKSRNELKNIFNNFTFYDYFTFQQQLHQAVPKHAVSVVLGTRFSAAPHAAAISAEPRVLAVLSWVFLVLAEKLHIPGVEPETKRMQHLNTTNNQYQQHTQIEHYLTIKKLNNIQETNNHQYNTTQKTIMTIETLTTTKLWRQQYLNT